MQELEEARVEEREKYFREKLRQAGREAREAMRIRQEATFL